MNKLNFYFDQVIGEPDMALFQNNIEKSDRALVRDLVIPGVKDGLEILPNDPADLAVRVIHGVAYDHYGQRIEVPGDGTVDCSAYIVTSETSERWITLVAKFGRNEYDEHQDGSGNPVLYRSDEYYQLAILIGDIAATGSASRPAPAVGEIVLADIRMISGQLTITASDIDTTRRAKTQVNDDVIGNRTIIDTAQPVTDTNTLNTLLNNLACQIKAITGAANWRTAPETTIAALKDNDNTSGIPIGAIMPFLALSPPAGWLACDTGALVSRATYAELWAWVQDNAPLTTEAEWQTMAAAQTSVGYYSSGDGSTTFRLPKLVDFVRGSDSANGRDVGSWQEDDNKEHFHSMPGGYIRGGSTDNWAGNGNSGQVAINPNILAPSTANSGGAETRPKNIAMLYCVKAFDAVVNEGLIDVTELANEVAGKQDRVLYARVVDEKTSGTDGGTFASGAWRTRTLNTTKNNDNNFVTLSNNQITLPAGTYRISASCPSSGSNSHQSRFYNITNSITAILGTSEDERNSSVNTGDGTNSRSFLAGQITLSNNTVFELQHRCSVTGKLGTPTSFDESEIYAVIEIWKVG